MINISIVISVALYYRQPNGIVNIDWNPVTNILFGIAFLCVAYLIFDGVRSRVTKGITIMTFVYTALAMAVFFVVYNYILYP